MQLAKAQLLQFSVDANVRSTWKAKEEREARMSRRLKISKLNRQVTAQVDLDTLFPTQASREGLGHGN